MKYYLKYISSNLSNNQNYIFWVKKKRELISKHIFDIFIWYKFIVTFFISTILLILWVYIKDLISIELFMIYIYIFGFIYGIVYGAYYSFITIIFFVSYNFLPNYFIKKYYIFKYTINDEDLLKNTLIKKVS